MKIYHNPRCRKSREALALLEASGKSFEIVEYLQHPLSKAELESVIAKLGIRAEDLLRKGESEFKEHYRGNSLTEGDCINAMLKFPKLMERPIVVSGNKAVIGRPPEMVNTLL